MYTYIYIYTHINRSTLVKLGGIGGAHGCEEFSDRTNAYDIIFQYYIILYYTLSLSISLYIYMHMYIHIHIYIYTYIHIILYYNISLRGVLRRQHAVPSLGVDGRRLRPHGANIIIIIIIIISSSSSSCSCCCCCCCCCFCFCFCCFYCCFSFCCCMIIVMISYDQ